MSHFCYIFWVASLLLAVDGYRLPTSVIPMHYKLEILTYLGEPNSFDFDGKVWIQLQCLHSTKNITLHSKKLNITENSVTVKPTGKDAKNKKPIKVLKVEEGTNDFLIIHLDQDLKEDNQYELYIPYRGQLEDSLAGFYRSSYVDKKTHQKRWLGVTQFEATSARKALPCFDEPAMKATFEIILGRKKEYSSISNMPLASTEPIKEKDGWYWDKYENSVPMSTYLLAFIVSDFGYKTSEPSKQNNVTFRIWARKDALNQVDFARNVGPKVLDFYENFFNIPYPLPKQDMVALPDFGAGAMENWGMITYRETYLLFDPQISSSTSQHGVASVIAHELAHQWFGNLVTMKWWTDLWLNEGFATYMAAVAVEHLYPQWNSLKEESLSSILNVFAFDALKSSHPVSVPIGHPNEIDEIFDTISYKKGSSLIRMMTLFLGEETLRKGVSNYLTKHKFGNAEQDDLWACLTDVAHKEKALPSNLTVKTVMDTWTVQTGYPVVTITRDYTKKSAEINQERFLVDIVKSKESDPCWWVPLSYTNGKELAFNSTVPKSWLSCPKSTQTIDNLPDEHTWVLFNIEIAGIYKVNYDEKNWKLLTDTLNSKDYKKIPIFNRVQLIDDASDLARTNNLKYEVLFDLLKYMRYEDEYLAWKSALANINLINKHIKKTSGYGNFKIYMKQLLTPVYEKVGGLVLSKANDGKLDAIKFQVLIIGWACTFEVASCIADVQGQFKNWQDNPKGENPIQKDLRKVIYCSAIKNGGEKEWDFLWKQYKKSNVASEKNTMLDTLGCTREIWLLNRYLEWSISEEYGIRRQDSTLVFSAVARNNVGYFVAKNFLYNNIDKIHKHLSLDTKRIAKYITGISSQMIDEKDYQEFQKFVKDKKKYLADVKQGVQQALETVKLNVQWQHQHFEQVNNLLKKFADESEKSQL